MNQGERDLSEWRRVLWMRCHGAIMEGMSMHHKRGKPKNQRAGCLMCKPHKMNGAAS